MNTHIQRTDTTNSSESLVIITSSAATFANYGFGKEEKLYLKNEIEKNKKNLVVLNQLSRIVFIALIDAKTNETKRLEECRKNGHKILTLLNEAKSEIAYLSGDAEFATETLALAEGMALSNYQFLKYFTKAATKLNSFKKLFILGKGISDKAVKNLQIVCEATCIARDFVNEPVSHLTAEQFSKEISLIGKEAGFKVEVLNKAKIEALKMGGLLAVNKGSIDPPTFTIMEWKPKSPSNNKPLILVGKGVVYDTGGVNIKTSGMDTMKCDMGGAAAVAATLYAVAKAKLNYHVIGLIPSTDNRPGGNAYVPGDVINMFDGTTVEVLNTDAEGRIILADALSYAKKYKPELVIDLATLTGAAQRAIGNYGIVGMGNVSEATKGKLLSSGAAVYERIADFPFWEEYADEIKSSIADIKNLGSSLAGAITAGKFLEHFTNYPWYHLDIAGPAFNEKSDSYRGKGGTGTGVRLLFDFIKTNSER